MRITGKKGGFTLIELLIVIGIIAILAATLAPNFVGFDKQARASTTKSNLDSLRAAIALYRVKTGSYPTTLEALATDTFSDGTVTKTYIKMIPPEMMSSATGASSVEDQLSSVALSNDGGWTYFTDKAEVMVDQTGALAAAWGEYSGQKPNEW